MSQTIKIYKSDTAPNMTFTITRIDGSIVDLTGATVKFKIQDPVTGVRTNDAANTCTLINAANGTCKYAWNNTDLPDPGTYAANLVIYYPTLDPEGVPQKESYGVTLQVTDTV